MQALNPDDPAQRITFLKSAQVGGSEIITNMILARVAAAPAPILIVHPTVDAAKKWGREKLNPSIAVSPTVARRIDRQRSRDSASTSTHKQFPGGFLALAGSNSAAGLRQSSISVLALDDLDAFAADADGEGDPESLSEKRTQAYVETGQVKILKISTPTIKGRSRIEQSYELSDKRVYELPCPHCGEYQDLVFKNLKFDGSLPPDAPQTPEYACRSCGCLWEEWRKPDLLAQGRWRATNPGPGRQPGFRISALYSPFTTWSWVVNEFLKSYKDKLALRVFTNTVLGESWEELGDAPPYSDLKARGDESNNEVGTVPDAALILTAGVDVQHNGLWWVVWGWSPDYCSHLVDYGWIDGDPSHDQTWRILTTRLAAGWRDRAGRRRPIELTAVDSGFQSDAVYRQCARHPGLIPIKGGSDPYAPAITAPPPPDKLNRQKRVWLLNTRTLKSDFYAHLRIQATDDHGNRSPGHIQFARGADENFYRQITSEQLIRKEINGRTEHVWLVRFSNHLLDATIYARAAARALRIHLWEQKQWDRALAVLDDQEITQADLFGPPPVARGPDSALAVEGPTDPAPAAGLAPEPLASSPAASAPPPIYTRPPRRPRPPAPLGAPGRGRSAVSMLED